jgi:hypothetical protein
MYEIDEARITNVEKLVQASLALYKWSRNNIVWYRGEAASRPEWKLAPSVYRATFSSAKDVEVELGFHFLRSAPTRYSSCPEPNDLAGWITLMQHYRLPTRLLDWSSSVVVAAFFAVSETKYKDEDATLWVLNPGALNEAAGQPPGLIYHLASPEVRKSLTPAFVRPASKENQPKPEDMKTFAVLAREIDARMMVQQAAFTLHGNPAPLDDMPGRDAFLKKFIIPRGAKVQIEQHLRLLGIRRSTLFPDLAGLAEDLRDVEMEKAAEEVKQASASPTATGKESDKPAQAPNIIYEIIAEESEDLPAIDPKSIPNCGYDAI